MARIRTIKPDFWTDSFMVQLPPLARLIYIALWTAADDHGLIPDEPERLAMEVMPKEDSIIFDDWMQFFEASGRIELFAAEDGETFYRVSKWEKHQRVDKPSKSRIFREGSRKVAIPLGVRRDLATKYGCSAGAEIDAQCYYCGSPGKIHWHNLGSGRPSAWVTFPGLEIDHLEAETFGGENSCENLVLACRSCNRSKGSKSWIEHLCSLNSPTASRILANSREPSPQERKGKGKEGNKEQGASPDGDTPDSAAREPQGSGRSPIPFQAIVDAYNLLLTKLPKVREVTPARKTAIRNAWNASPDRKSLDFWTAYFEECADDSFLNGTGPYTAPHENWRPDFDFLMKPKTIVRTYERALDRLERAA